MGKRDYSVTNGNDFSPPPVGDSERAPRYQTLCACRDSDVIRNELLDRCDRCLCRLRPAAAPLSPQERPTPAASSRETPAPPTHKHFCRYCDNGEAHETACVCECGAFRSVSYEPWTEAGASRATEPPTMTPAEANASEGHIPLHVVPAQATEPREEPLTKEDYEFIERNARYCQEELDRANRDYDYAKHVQSPSLLRTVVRAARAVASLSAENARLRETIEGLRESFENMRKALDSETDLRRAAYLAKNQAEAENARLREDAAKVCEAFDAGLFVRNTRDDGESGWAMKFLPYVQALSRLAALGPSSPDTENDDAD